MVAKPYRFKGEDLPGSSGRSSPLENVKSQMLTPVGVIVLVVIVFLHSMLPNVMTIRRSFRPIKIVIASQFAKVEILQLTCVRTEPTIPSGNTGNRSRPRFPQNSPK